MCQQGRALATFLEMLNAAAVASCIDCCMHANASSYQRQGMVVANSLIPMQARAIQVAGLGTGPASG